MALNFGAKLVLFIDGQKIGTLQSVDIESNSGKVRIDTLEGLAGASIGSGDVKITGDCYVPIGGQEVDIFSEATQLSGFHDMQIGIGAGAYKGSGWFENSKISQSSNSETKVSFSWLGESNPLE